MSQMSSQAKRVGDALVFASGPWGARLVGAGVQVAPLVGGGLMVLAAPLAPDANQMMVQSMVGVGMAFVGALPTVVDNIRGLNEKAKPWTPLVSFLTKLSDYLQDHPAPSLPLLSSGPRAGSLNAAVTAAQHAPSPPSVSTPEPVGHRFRRRPR